MPIGLLRVVESEVASPFPYSPIFAQTRRRMSRYPRGGNSLGVRARRPRPSSSSGNVSAAAPRFASARIFKSWAMPAHSSWPNGVAVTAGLGLRSQKRKNALTRFRPMGKTRRSGRTRRSGVPQQKAGNAPEEQTTIDAIITKREAVDPTGKTPRARSPSSGARAAGALPARRQLMPLTGSST